MAVSSFLKTSCAYSMAVLMTNAPHVVLAEVGQEKAGKMISTSVVVDELSRAQAQEKVSRFLERSDVKDLLVSRGVSEKEAMTRLASLSESELKHLASQVDQAKAGGDILITILVVVLIIFLIRRI